jgi:hypothetical protein
MSHIICAGEPFEQQTFIGPFKSFDEAATYVGEHFPPMTERYRFTWIISMESPDEYQILSDYADHHP